jgi:hypothetical protein
METITKKLIIVMLTFLVSMFVGIQIHESGHEEIYKNFDVEYKRGLFEVVPTSQVSEQKRLAVDTATSCHEQNYISVWFYSLGITLLMAILIKDGFIR